MEKVKTLGKRIGTQKGLKAIAEFLKMVIRIRKDKLFVPKGLYKFKSHEQAQEWMLKMTTRAFSEKK